MKTSLSYYGGKQPLSVRIVGLIPEHRLYCEPFLGGETAFFAKEAAAGRDHQQHANGEIANFYEVLQRDFSALEKEAAISLRRRRLHDQAWVVYNNPEMFDT